MTQRTKLIVLATAALAIANMMGLASRGVAQDRPMTGAFELAEAGAQKKTVAPKMVAPKATAPRTAAPKAVTPRRTAPTGPKTVTPKRVVTPKAVTTKKVVIPKRVVTPKAIAPKAVIPKGVAPKIVSPSGRGLRAVGTRSTARVVIGGRNYSVWRGARRVRHDGRWATLGAISALSIFFYGGANYYPYAYLSATGPYCEGVTEDGCILRWEEVPTLEGPRVFQCVAYCPWQ